MSQVIRFAVMGDMHHVWPEGHQEALAGRAAGPTEEADVKRNHWMTEHVTPRVLAHIKALRPDFVVQTGDLIHGHCDTTAANIEEMRQALARLDTLGVPYYVAFGTHDGTLGRREDEALKELMLPALSKNLGRPLTNGYYTFERSGALFVVLDYAAFTPGDAQHACLQQALAEGKWYDHLFVFAHPPLVPVGRPFFTSRPFATAVLQALAGSSADAYFCGHTHNQAASLHRVGANWLPQLKSSVLGYPDQAPVHLADVRPILPSADACEYGWGFLEDSAPGWWIVEVNGDAVRAEWHVLNHGVAGCLEWQRGQRPRFVQLPGFQHRGHELPPLATLKRVRLRAAGTNCRAKEGYAVSVNGQFAGYLPRLEYFDCRQFMEIPPALWPLLYGPVHLSVTTAHEDMCIGGFVLEAETADGTITSTLVSGFYSNSTRWAEPFLQRISPGETVKVELAFATDSTGTQDT